MTLFVLEDETADHIYVSFFHADAIMTQADGRAHLIEQRWLSHLKSLPRDEWKERGNDPPRDGKSQLLLKILPLAV